MNNKEKENQDLLKRKRKREEIMKNFSELEGIFKSDRAQNIFNSLGIFSLEEYSKFFQNLSNKEYKSMNEYRKKNKEPISIEKSKIQSLLDYSSKINELSISIKDILKSNLQPKGINKKIKENRNKIIPKKEHIDFDLYLNSVSENINNIINSRKELDINIFKQMIKAYSILIRTIDQIQFKQDDTFIELSKKYLNKSIKDFYNITLFWLNTEYLLCSEKKNSEINKYKRYDLILNNIINILEQLLENSKNIIINYDSDFNQFISNVPLYNKIFINFIIKYQKTYLENKSEEINEKLKNNREMSIFEVIPFLENVKYIYINIVFKKNLVENKDRDEFRKNLLENFLLLSRNKNYINAKALEFIFNEIYNISKFEQSVIKNFGNQGIDEIKTLNEEEEKEQKIKQRFFFYFSLCKIDNENILKLPSIYDFISQSIKDMINPYIEKRFNDLLRNNKQFFAEQLIKECKENSEEIVICVIKNIYGNPEYKFENSLENEKLYRNIKSYYMKYSKDLTKGVIEISNKIPLKDFFTTYNFVLNKIKQYEQKPELINEILEKINSKEINKNILGNNYESIFNKINNKILFYLLYYYQNVTNEEYKYYKDIMIKYHAMKLFELKKESLDYFNFELTSFSDELIKDGNINLSVAFDIYDNYKENISKINDISNEDSEFIYQEFDKMLINIINEKIKEERNTKLLEEYYDKLSKDNKKIFKDKIIKNISEQAKSNLDLILFGDI